MHKHFPHSHIYLRCQAHIRSIPVARAHLFLEPAGDSWQAAQQFEAAIGKKRLIQSETPEETKQHTHAKGGIGIPIELDMVLIQYCIENLTRGSGGLPLVPQITPPENGEPPPT